MDNIEAAVADVLTDGALADRLKGLSKDIRRYSVSERKAFLDEAAKRLEVVGTVNVLEMVDGNILSLRIFPNTLAGNENATELFFEVAKQNGMEEQETENWVNGESYENGDYSVFLCSSN